jgi:photosystem II stability/assembly factor-like uncharacterized protein
MVINKKMKNKSIVLGCFLALLFMSGCSLGLTGTKPQGDQKFAFAKSIWLSRDGGKDWKPAVSSSLKPPVSDPNPLLMVFDDNNADVAYLGLLSGGIMSTADRGETWDFLKLKSDKIYGLALDPINSKIIYSSALIRGRGKIMKSLDGGEEWEEKFTFPMKGPLVISMVVDKRNPKVVLASSSDNQIIKSVDGGDSWKNIFQPSSPVGKIVMDSSNSKLLFLLTQSGNIYFSQNGGDTFEDMSERLSGAGLDTSGYRVLEVDPSHSGWLYLGGKMGIVRSKDVGVVWDQIVILNNPESAPVAALAINPTNSQEIIYNAAQALFKSVDEGKTWSTTQFEIAKPMRILKYHPSDASIVYAGFMAK